MKNIYIIFSILAVVALGFEIKSLYIQTGEARAEYDQSRQDFAKAKDNSDKLSADLNYYMNPQNLEKELRARFNYKNPDEKLIIIVPSVSTSSASSTGSTR